MPVPRAAWIRIGAPRWREALSGCAAGALLGGLAWGEGRAPVLALALPLAVAFSRSRLQASCIGFGYAAAVLRYAAGFIAGWFDDDLAIGVAAVLGYAVATGAIWCAGWSGSARFARRALAICVAWGLALVGGIAVPGHPVIAAGYLLPDSGWLGFALAWMLPVLALGGARSAIFSSPAVRHGVAAAGLFALGLAGVLADAALPIAAPAAVHAQQTHWGALHGQDEALLRMQRMGAAPVPAAATTVVWPEGILGRYEPALRPALEVELLRPARTAGRTHVVGLDLPLPGNRSLNAAIAFYPDGRTATAVARQPAPLSLWKPWRESDTFVADWRASNVLDLGPGRAAVIFCYEEYAPIFYLLNEAFDAPDVYLAIANTWAAASPHAGAIQTRHSLGIARLFGRPYFKAENRPRA